MRKEIGTHQFYHVYPLGLSGAPERNDFVSEPVPRLLGLLEWIEHWKDLGISALYLGPVFESTAHGYDTADYYTVDRRLGRNEDMKTLSDALHGAGIKLVLDGVFHHTGRDFDPFRDLLAHARRGDGPACPWRDWFSGIDFNQVSPAGDPFRYDGWNGHYDLVKLDLNHPGVRDHIAGAVGFWITEWDIDGIRLDAADCLDPGFLRYLSGICRKRKEALWLMGEVIHGDYRRWVQPGSLDSVTNYEMYKSLWSGFNDGNLFETAYALNRQSGQDGIYREMTLYNFQDNHDVNRIASILKNREQLYPVHLLLYTIPGVPSIYYGSEFACPGERTPHSDRALRPELSLTRLYAENREPGLLPVIKRLSDIRKGSPALREGRYRELGVNSHTLVFSREANVETVVVMASARPLGSPPEKIDLPWPGNGSICRDLLNNETFFRQGDRLVCDLFPNWGRILRLE
jgi:glycosidase